LAVAAALLLGLAVWYRLEIGDGARRVETATDLGSTGDRGPDGSVSELDRTLESLDRALSALGSSLDTLEPRGSPAPSDDRGVPGDAAGPATPQLEEYFETLERRCGTLMRRYDELEDAQERISLVREFAERFPLYARRSRGTHQEHLDFLRRVARSEWPDARRHAVIAVHGLSGDDMVAFLVEHTTSPFPEVRFYAAEGLAWSARAGDPEAAEALVQALGHEDERVRGIIAVSIGTVVQDARLVPHLLSRLRVERKAGVIHRLVRAIVALTGDEGIAKIGEAAASRTDGDAREVIERIVGEVRASKRR